jgi:hypothetical protein
MEYRAIHGDRHALPANDQPSNECARLRDRVRRRAEWREVMIAWGAVAVPLSAAMASFVVWATR